MLTPPRIEGPSSVRPTGPRRSKPDAVSAAPEREEDAAPRVERLEPRGEDRRRWNGEERRRDWKRRASWVPHAPLVAQLIATALGLAQTRSRRRGAMEQALEAYKRTEKTPGVDHGAA